MPPDRTQIAAERLDHHQQPEVLTTATKKSTRAAKAQCRKRFSSPQLNIGDLAELVYGRAPHLSPGYGLATRKTECLDGTYREEYGWEIQIGGDPGLYTVLPDQLRPIRPKDPLQAVRRSKCPRQPGTVARRTRRHGETQS